MKYIIKPSIEEVGYVAVEIDTQTNEDGTAEAVRAVFAALVASGHHPRNVAEMAMERAGEMLKESQHD